MFYYALPRHTGVHHVLLTLLRYHLTTQVYHVESRGLKTVGETLLSEYSAPVRRLAPAYAGGVGEEVDDKFASPEHFWSRPQVLCSKVAK